MPLFPHAALILEPGVIFVESHISCADGRIIPGYREAPNIRVKTSLLSKGIGARCRRNDLTLRFPRRTQLATILFNLQPLRFPLRTRFHIEKASAETSLSIVKSSL